MIRWGHAGSVVPWLSFSLKGSYSVPKGAAIAFDPVGSPGHLDDSVFWELTRIMSGRLVEIIVIVKENVKPYRPRFRAALSSGT